MAQHVSELFVFYYLLSFMCFKASATATVVAATAVVTTIIAATTAVTTKDAAVVTATHRQNKKDDYPSAAIAAEKTVVTRHSLYPLSSYTLIICRRCKRVHSKFGTKTVILLQKDHKKTRPLFAALIKQRL